ncbi:hypothetical protein NEOLEDRAFT_463050 [Neolentinus lepideus HHB14362 ss-1]|uniref:Uncharacterized protein n=1 Tax=Neolentinus lepideus HHB14362 ss-1 TaxID=1314782 RepID=A0A165VHA9_9AGAM|nr:hypothetical protein NEOLEDRAFT_463050 [Neolentinus lepideus HHB14362 ss-1]
MFHQRYHEQGLPLKRMMLAVHFVYKKPNHDAGPDILTLLVQNSKSPWSRQQGLIPFLSFRVKLSLTFRHALPQLIPR